MFTILLVMLFFVVVALGVILAMVSARQPRFEQPTTPASTAPSRDPFAPILRAGFETDETTTVKMVIR